MTGTAVVITCFNLGRYLDEAVHSVLEQTRPVAELVVIDDGSDDLYSREAIRRAAERGICVMSTTNRGVASARNLGVSLTSAPYIVILDADDVLMPAYIERLAGELDRRADLGFVTCALQAFGDADYLWTPPPCTWVQMIVRGGPHVSTVFRREAWNRVGEFDSSLAGYEDQDFWLSAVECGFRGDVCAEPLLRYRVRQGSRYHQALQPDRYLSTIAAIHRRHPPASDRMRTELLDESDRFLQELHAHDAGLSARRRELERTSVALHQAIDRTAADLVSADIPPIDWGDLRRVTPVSPNWGIDRGKPLDRVYIEAFLEQHREDIHGRVAEMKDAGYTKRFGSGVTQADVIDINARNPAATILADLGVPLSLPSDTFDCVVFTQTLHVIYDTKTVLQNLYGALKPGGVLLCTMPSVSRVSYEDGGLDGGDFWRFTEASARSVFSEVFPPDAIEVSTFGNVMTCAAFLHGLDPGEIGPDVLEKHDPLFPMLCCVRTVKPTGAVAEMSRRLEGLRRVRPVAGTILLYHRVGTRQPDSHRLCIDVAAFREQMGWLQQECQVLPLASLVARSVDRDLPERAVAVTFDDGYAEHLTVASPILLEFGIPATFFVNTAHVDAPVENWWDVLEQALLAENVPDCELDLADHGIAVLPLKTAADRTAAARLLNERIYPMNARDRDALVDAVVGQCSAQVRPRDTHRPMSGDEFRELGSRPGHDIGAHSVNHLALPHHARATQSAEVEGCKQQLERLLGRPITAFAYPYGDVTGITVDVVRQAGFTRAVTVEGRSLLPAAHPLLLPRFEISGLTDGPFAGWLGRRAAHVLP